MIPVTVSFHGMHHSDRIARDIVSRAQKLGACCDRITSCHVVVEAPPRHQKKGNHLAWGIELTAPRAKVAISRADTVGDAFDLARRRLLERAARRRASRRGRRRQAGPSTARA